LIQALAERRAPLAAVARPPSMHVDGDRAEALMREHMQEFVDRFEERFGGFMDERIDWF